MEKTSHIPFMIICSRYWSLQDLMGIAGFPSLGIPLNLTEPAYLDHASSVFFFSLRFCWHNWPLLIFPHQLLKSSLYWSPRTIKSFSSLDQVKEFILVSGAVPDQGIIDPWSSLYNTPHSGPYNLTLGPFIASDHFITNMVDIALSGAWLLIIAPSGAESSIILDSCFSSSEKKPQSGWLPFGENQSSNFINLLLILEFSFH